MEMFSTKISANYLLIRLKEALNNKYKWKKHFPSIFFPWFSSWFCLNTCFQISIHGAALWDTTPTRKSITHPQGPEQSCAWFSCSNMWSMRLWRLAKPLRLHRLLGHTGRVDAAADPLVERKRWPSAVDKVEEISAGFLIIKPHQH